MSERVDVRVDDGHVPVTVLGPSEPSGHPVLVVVPSIFGPAADLVERLSPLAATATIAIPDPFWRTGEGVVPYDDIDTAFGRLAEFDFEACGSEMTAVVAWARDRGNGTVIGLGICFGGPYVLRLAVAGQLDGLVTWHGSRMEQSLDRVADIACPVRHHLGSADPITPPETIEALREAFADHDDAQIIVHEGATHGFSHDGDAFDPVAYRAGFESVRGLLFS